MTIKEELKKLAKTDFDQLIINHMATVADVVNNYSLDEKVKKIAYEAALLHDIGKLKIVKKTMFKDYTNQHNFRLSLLHGVTGAAYLQTIDKKLTAIIKEPDSVIKVIACHSPYYLTESELKDLKESSLPYPLPRWDSNKTEQEYPIGKLQLKIEKLNREEKVAAEAVILADHSVAYDIYVGVDKRLENIFLRYDDVLSEKGKKIYERRIKKIEKKIEKDK